MVCCIGFRHHQQPAGVAVDAVNDAGTNNTVDAGELVTAVIQQRMHQRSGGMAGCGVHHHALGFIHHQQVGVLIDDIQRNVLRFQRQRLRFRQGDLDDIAATLAVVFGNRRSVHQHRLLFHAQLHCRTCHLQITLRCGKPLVQTFAGELLRYRKSYMFRHSSTPVFPLVSAGARRTADTTPAAQHRRPRSNPQS